jgi:predicted enzyme related to lactoylglutathione lyase
MPKHSFCHIEIPATNVEQSSQFYAALFGWPIMKMEGMDYVMFGEQNGGVYGGITGVEKILSDPSVCNYVEVEDIPAILKKAESLGAKTTREKTEIPGGMGAFAVFQDPQGYYLGIWSKD